MPRSEKKTRCDWCLGDELYQAYHDEEWGLPLYSDQKLLEFLILEGVQAGLSWITVLRKRENYQIAFDEFDPEKIAAYDDGKIRELLENPGIVRNKMKINSAINNARCYLDVLATGVSFSDYIWRFVDGKPIQNRFKSMAEVPPLTPLSEQMSRSLKQAGFNFVGPTICYAFMQATGMVNDHMVSCYRYLECQ